MEPARPTKRLDDLPPELLAQLEHLLFRDRGDPGDGIEALASQHPQHAAGIRAWWAAASRLGDAAHGEHPRQIGPYRVLALLGSGGFGEVWRAEQQHPVRREVALKVLKLGMDSAAILQRFAREQDALARMSHDAVAKIFDAGTTAAGQPYFAMELVDGAPITLHCDRHRMPLRQRVELFARVCLGVHHAHQKGVVHRDLKPGNVLVAQVGEQHVPKLIDFGIARALEGDGSDVALTETGTMLGTPAYMAPEQARGDLGAIDTRTDVYALGAILYELLTGASPLGDDLTAAPSPWLLRERIVLADTPKPSTRAATVGGQAATWQRQLRNELDWIVLKAMAKEPERRYASAAELAADLQRYLQQEPVLAGPPSASYRVSKFVRRYRLQVAATAAVLGTALAGAFVAVRYAIAADESASLASQRAAQLSTKVGEFNQLARVVELERVRDAERTLYPPWPEQAAALQRWLDGDCGALLRGREDVRSALTELRHRARAKNADELDAARTGHTRWRELIELRERRDALQGIVARGEREQAEGTPTEVFADVLTPLRQLDRGSIGKDVPLVTEAQLVAEALEQARRQLADVEQAEAELAAAIEAQLPPAFADAADAFLFEALRRLEQELDALERDERARVLRRLAWAQSVAAATLAHPGAPLSWQRLQDELDAASAAGSGSPYEGKSVRVPPQTGLVPMGRNPRTGLFEFYDLLSAWDGAAAPTSLAVPSIDAEGRVAVGDDTGIVFVLLPGGESRFGAQRDDPDGPFFDADAPPDLSVHRAVLAPFLIARHELTQGQWRRLAALTGDDPLPSYYKTGTNMRMLAFHDRSPVENVSWLQANELLRRSGMALPSEVQWEYSCRAGTTTPWSCAFEQLVRCANLADRHYGFAAGRTNDFEPWDDLYSVPAPVGRLGMNAFGLHDVHGNLAEWCGDPWGAPGGLRRAGDGQRIVGEGTSHRVLRGGSFSHRAAQAKSHERAAAAATVQSSFFGVRAVRRLS